MSDREDTKARVLKNTRFERATTEIKGISKSRAPVWETLNANFDMCEIQAYNNCYGTKHKICKLRLKSNWNLKAQLSINSCYKSTIIAAVYAPFLIYTPL